MTVGFSKIIALAVIILSIVSCDNFYNDSGEYDEAIAMVESMRVDTVVNTTATLTFTCFTPTPCWSFSRIEETRDSNNIRLTIYRKVKRNITCVQMTGSFKQTADFSVPAPGPYTIKMYRTPTTTTDTTINF